MKSTQALAGMTAQQIADRLKELKDIRRTSALDDKIAEKISLVVDTLGNKSSHTDDYCRFSVEYSESQSCTVIMAHIGQTAVFHASRYANTSPLGLCIMLYVPGPWVNNLNRLAQVADEKANSELKKALMKEALLWGISEEELQGVTL